MWFFAWCGLGAVPKHCCTLLNVRVDECFKEMPLFCRGWLSLSLGGEVVVFWRNTRQGLIHEFSLGGGEILVSDSISGQDIGICIVCFGLLVVFVLVL